MAALNETAKAALKDAGVSQAAWARYHGYSDGRWGGDACGCPDDRCMNGFHHDGPDDCGCLPVLLAQMLAEHAMPETRYDRRLRAVRRAISDPGSVLPREIPAGSTRFESQPDWQARAVLATITPWLKEDPDE